MFEKLDISKYEKLNNLFPKNLRLQKSCVGQAGVRYSLKNPKAYIKSNIDGFMNILECSRKNVIKGLICTQVLLCMVVIKKLHSLLNHQTDSPLSIYAVTKKSNKLIAKAYSHLYDINTIGLRFFTVPFHGDTIWPCTYCQKYYRR